MVISKNLKPINKFKLFFHLNLISYEHRELKRHWAACVYSEMLCTYIP